MVLAEDASLLARAPQQLLRLRQLSKNRRKHIGMLRRCSSSSLLTLRGRGGQLCGMRPALRIKRHGVLVRSCSGCRSRLGRLLLVRRHLLQQLLPLLLVLGSQPLRLGAASRQPLHQLRLVLLLRLKRRLLLSQLPPLLLLKHLTLPLKLLHFAHRLLLLLLHQGNTRETSGEQAGRG